MGKRKQGQNKLYITHTEWKKHFGGYKDKSKRPFQKLPYNYCSLSLQPFKTPVCTPDDGLCYDIMHIVPWIKEKKTNPVTGKPMSMRDLLQLHFHKNANGKWICPLTYKEFTNNSHIVAIKTSGNVFSWEAVQSLNIKAKCMEDLITGDKFTKADIITIQDPTQTGPRDISSFRHVTAGDGEEARGSIKANSSLQRVMDQLPSGQQALKAKKEVSELKALTKTDPERAAKLIKTRNAQMEQKKADAGRARARFTSGQVSGSFTSTALTPSTENTRAFLTDEQILEQRYRFMRLQPEPKKAYVRLHTTLGPVNLELHCGLVPKTCHNFLLLCQRNYYVGTKFHRLIKGFMIQGGDPTGTGRGGESAWGGTFHDEFDDALKHDLRGQISMANSGKHSNKSQFFITFNECSHLDGKHAVFGRVVGGKDTLAAMENAKCGGTKETREKPAEDITITDITIFTNPFDEEFIPVDELELQSDAKTRKKLAHELRLPAAKTSEEDLGEKGAWFSKPQQNELKAHGTGVGKYIQKTGSEDKAPEKVGSAASASDGSTQSKTKMKKKKKRKNEGPILSLSSAAVQAKRKKKVVVTKFGDFSAW